ncbi:transposable element Tcb2 transposase [Trichonephila clavipes]|nr:transposable element Tcb2 transposase [Trichonephila clavipes]
MARRNQLDDFTRGRMIGKLEEGLTVTSVAAEFEINKSVVSRAWKRSKPQVQQLERLVVAARGRLLQGMTDVSSRKQKEADGMVQRAQKLDNCQWSRVLFTDESRFSTRSDSQSVLIWREIGTRFYTSNIKKRHHYGGPGVLVWGNIMLNGRTELHIFYRGSVTGNRYCGEVLLPHVRLFRGAIGPNFLFMDDNERPHRTLAVDELLESEDITRMDWPAYSTDLNPIEHVWDALGRRIAARLHHPENTQQRKQMLIEEWALLPQEMLHQLVLIVAIGATPGQNIVIFIDSEAAIKTLSGYNLFPSKLEFECKQFINSFLCTGREVVLQWIPSHCGFHGSEQANKLAKEALTLHPPCLPMPLRNANVAAVAQWYRYRIMAGFVTSLSPVPLKTHRVEQRCTLNLSRAQTFSRWCGGVVRTGKCHLRCRPRHLTMVQNDVVRHQKTSCS